MEIRCSRVVCDMEKTLSFSMGTGLGSGDAWTLIANKIMAMSTLVAKYIIPRGVQMLQTGDDITLDRMLIERVKPIHAFPRVVMTYKNHTIEGRPSFTSNISLNENLAIAARIRGIIKMGHNTRSREQHLAYKAEVGFLINSVSEIGLEAYCTSHAHLLGSEADVLEVILSQAIRICQTSYDDLDDKYKVVKDTPLVTIRSRDWGCFGFALAYCIDDNVKAINALSMYSREMALAECLEVCELNNVPYYDMKVPWRKSLGDVIVSKFLEEDMVKPTVFLFEDHAVAVTPLSRSRVTESGSGRFTVNLVTEEVEFFDF